MTGWIVLLGLLALVLALTMVRRRILQAPGDHLGQGTHAFDGSEDPAPTAASTTPDGGSDAGD